MNAASAPRSRWWVLADQAASNATNVIGLALIGRWLAPADFGVVALVFSVLPVAVLTARGTWGESLLILSPVRGQRDDARSPVALGGSLVTGLVFAVLAMGVALILPEHGAVVAVVALFVPLLLLHDTARYVRFAEGRPMTAFVSDAAWFVVSVPALLLAQRTGGGPARLVAGWFVGLVPAAMIALVGVRLSLRGVTAWLRDDRRTWAPLLGDLGGSAGFRALALVVVITMSGFEDGGGFRAAQVLMGPITVLTLAAAPLFLYSAPSRTLDQTTRTVAVAAASLGGAAMTWLIVVLVLPSAIGEVALGAAWSAAEPLIGPVGLYHVAAAAALAPVLGLRALRRTGVAFVIRIGSGAALVAAAALGAAVGGARVAGYSMAAVEAITLAVATIALRRPRRTAAMSDHALGSPSPRLGVER